MSANQVNSVFARGNVARLPPPIRLVVEEPRFAWRDASMKRMKELMDLPIGWDGYHGLQLKLENAVFALRMLEAACGPEVSPPQIVPGPGGDLQIEWHTRICDIELHVKAPNRVHAWRAMVGGAEEGEELELTLDFSKVAIWIKQMMELPIAAATAAA